MEREEKIESENLELIKIKKKSHNCLVWTIKIMWNHVVVFMNREKE